MTDKHGSHLRKQSLKRSLALLWAEVPCFPIMQSGSAFLKARSGRQTQVDPAASGGRSGDARVLWPEVDQGSRRPAPPKFQVSPGMLWCRWGRTGGGHDGGRFVLPSSANVSPQRNGSLRGHWPLQWTRVSPTHHRAGAPPLLSYQQHIAERHSTHLRSPDQKFAFNVKTNVFPRRHVTTNILQTPADTRVSQSQQYPSHTLSCSRGSSRDSSTCWRIPPQFRPVTASASPAQVLTSGAWPPSWTWSQRQLGSHRFPSKLPSATSLALRAGCQPASGGVRVASARLLGARQAETEAAGVLFPAAEDHSGQVC